MGHNRQPSITECRLILEILKGRHSSLSHGTRAVIYSRVTELWFQSWTNLGSNAELGSPYLVTTGQPPHLSLSFLSWKLVIMLLTSVLGQLWGLKTRS